MGGGGILVWRAGRGAKSRQRLLNAVLTAIVVLNFFLLSTLLSQNDSHQRKGELVPHRGAAASSADEEDEQSSHPDETLVVAAFSSKDQAWVSINAQKVFDTSAVDRREPRGLYMVIVNPNTGRLLQLERFDTYAPGVAPRLVSMLKTLREGRIAVFVVCDEATYSLSDEARSALERLGSTKISALGWRDSWAMVTKVGQPDTTVEISQHSDQYDWGGPVVLQTEFKKDTRPLVQCRWPATPENEKRRAFCSLYDGYENVCKCREPTPLFWDETPTFKNLEKVPTLVVGSSSRPKYLFRALLSLLHAKGAMRSNVIVSIDSFSEESEAADICHLLGVKVLRHTPTGVAAGKVAEHYSAALQNAFNAFPDAGHLIVLEEDIDTSLDFYRYFSTTLPFLERDPTLYCVSAWNDQGYKHSCNDPTRLYRVETMPGLGWMLSRRLFESELKPNWPHHIESGWDWDMWMRSDSIRKGRECIIPDVSRTFHFGASGVNIFEGFQKSYFEGHALNLDAQAVVDTASIMLTEYDAAIAFYLGSARVLNIDVVLKGPLLKDNNMGRERGDCFIQPPVDDRVQDGQQAGAGASRPHFALYIDMAHRTDYETWMLLAKCWGLWDLDARGFHKGVWQFYLKHHRIAVVGVPYSPFSKYMPANVTPIQLRKDR